MLYGMKFDNQVGAILSNAGYTTNSQKFAVWPAGLSASLIKQGKQLGIDAKSAAYIGLLKYFSTASELSQNQKIGIVNAAVMTALRDSSVDQSVLQQLQLGLSQMQGDSQLRKPDF